MKLANLSCVRLIATLMIFSCHILQGLNLELAFWVNVGVQIFFVLSGYLYSKKKINNTKEFYKKQYKKIMIPYIILLVIMILITLIQSKEIILSKFMLLGAFLGFQGWSGTFQGLTHTWFISYILLCYLITPILKQIKVFNDTNNYKKTIIVFILFAIVLQLSISFNVLRINGSYILLYIMGYILGNTNKDSYKKLCLVFMFLTIITLPLRIMVQYYENNTLISLINYFRIGIDNFISYNHGLLGITLFLLIIIFTKKIKYNTILYYSDKYSYYIYLVHQIFILNDYSLLHITNSLTINILLISLITIIAAILLYYLTKILEIGAKKIQNKLKNNNKYILNS